MKSSRLSVILPLLGGLSLFVLWAAIIVIGEVPEYIAPPPWAVAREIVDNLDLLYQNFKPTLLIAVSGFVVGNLCAVAVSTVFVHYKKIQMMYLPVAVLFNTIPIIAMAPILILIFGINMIPKIIISAIICFFPTLMNMIKGLESCTPNELELMRVMNVSQRELFFKLRLPRALPFLFAALRISATASVIGAIVAEWIGSNLGIGALIIQATFNYRSGLLYAAIFMSSVLALTLFSAVVLTEKKVVNWK